MASLLSKANKTLEGNKTYLVAGATFAYALLGLALNLHDAQRTIDLLLAAGAMVGFRSALAKLEK